MATFPELLTCLQNPSDPIAKRNRAIFMIKHLGGDEWVRTLIAAFPTESTLLDHEICYALGQIQNPLAIEFLSSVLRDETKLPIIRHEAAEAMGAIGDQAALSVLQEFLNCEEQNIAETCSIALDRVKWLGAQENATDIVFSAAIDPAPAFPTTLYSQEELKDILHDTKKSLFERYRALFTLRDLKDESSISIIGDSLVTGDFSPLFKHEIAFVLGELGTDADHTSAQLMKTISDTHNHVMVRHEAAEALGATFMTEEKTEFLQKFKEDGDLVISQSCEVALDIMDYWNDDSAI